MGQGRLRHSTPINIDEDMEILAILQKGTCCFGISFYYICICYSVGLLHIYFSLFELIEAFDGGNSSNSKASQTSSEPSPSSAKVLG